MMTYMIPHNTKFSKSQSFRLVRNLSFKNDSGQAGMTKHAQ